MEENQKIPMRSQVKKEDTWAIEDMYATVEDWEKDFAAAKKVAEEAAEYAGRLGESAQALYDWSALTEKLDCMLSSGNEKPLPERISPSLQRFFVSGIPAVLYL